IVTPSGRIVTFWYLNVVFLVKVTVTTCGVGITIPVGGFTVFFSNKIAGLIPWGTASFSVTLNPCLGNMHLPLTLRIDGPGGIIFRIAFHPEHLPETTLALTVLALAALDLPAFAFPEVGVFRAGIKIAPPYFVWVESMRGGGVFTTFPVRPQGNLVKIRVTKLKGRREINELAG